MEELKLILQAIGTAGETGKWMYVAYLAKDILINLLGYFFGVFVLYFSYKFGMTAIKHGNFISNIAMKVGYTTPFSDREKLDILKRLEK